MNVKNVSQPITLPEEIKKAIDKVRSQLEVSKGELLIIQKTRYSESASVEQLIRQRQFLNKEIADSKVALKELKEEFEIVSTIVERDKKEVEGLKVTLEKLNEEAEKIVKEKAIFEEDKNDKELKLSEKQAELDKREKEIEKKEAKADEKLSEFKKFMKKYE
ncbi:MAG: hypothetical protein OEV44_01065 [Spirochaetota bacterium]|nr:hypothetical protein [Spirochaetota bacterium]